MTIEEMERELNAHKDCLKMQIMINDCFNVRMKSLQTSIDNLDNAIMDLEEYIDRFESYNKLDIPSFSGISGRFNAESQ